MTIGSRLPGSDTKRRGAQSSCPWRHVRRVATAARVQQSHRRSPAAQSLPNPAQIRCSWLGPPVLAAPSHLHLISRRTGLPPVSFLAALPEALGLDHKLDRQQAVSRSRSTMKEVAEHANVSLSTVSYVVNNSGPVAADRRARRSRRFGKPRYTPNEVARRLKRAFGFGHRPVRPRPRQPVLCAARPRCRARGVGTRRVGSVVRLRRKRRTLNARLLRSQRVDGVIYLSGTWASTSSLLDFARTGGAG